MHLLNLPQPILPEVLETLGALGIEVSPDHFSLNTGSIDDDRNISNPPSPEIRDFVDEEEAAVAQGEGSLDEELEATNIGDPLDIKEEAEDVVEAFEGIAVGQAFHVKSSVSPSCKENWQDIGKINKVQVKKEKPHECSQCLKKFSLKGDLNKHIEVVHNKTKPFQCTQCLKKFGDKGSLNRHIEVVHKKSKPHQCSHCSEKFSLKHLLKIHMMRVHNFKKPHPCVEQNCDEKFAQLSELRDHLRSAHGAAKLVCGVQNCAATFTRRRTLLYHRTRHHSDK